MVRPGTNTLALALLGAAQAVSAHTWIETMHRISSTGTFTGEIGYPMGYWNRSAVGFADDKVMNKMLDKTAAAPICREFSQGDYNNPDYPPLTASPGEWIAASYLENGHVTDPDQTPRPYRGGNVYVYGSKTAGKSVTLQDLIGDKKRDDLQLLSVHYYDDGQCYQQRSDDFSYLNVWVERKTEHGNAEVPCQNDFQLPEDLEASGEYTIYWFWDWPMHPNTPQATFETYSSCATIKLAPVQKRSSANGIKFAPSPDTDIRQVAIQSQLETPIEALVLGTGTASPPAPIGLPTAPAGNNPKPTAPASNHPKTTAPAVNKPQHAAPANPASTPSTTKQDGGVKTVTVTAQPQTVTETVTVEPPQTTLQTSVRNGGQAGQAGQASHSTTTYQMTFTADAAPIVTPFQRARRTGQARRDASA